MTYRRMFSHVVWGTKRREPLVDGERGAVIERSIRATCQEAGVVVRAVGLMPEHVHLAVSIPPKFAISDVVKRLKGESSHLLNHSSGADGADWFSWQSEHGALSFDEESLGSVIAYVQNQSAHHAATRSGQPSNSSTAPSTNVSAFRRRSNLGEVLHVEP